MTAGARLASLSPVSRNSNQKNMKILEKLLNAQAGGFIACVWRRDCKTLKGVSSRVEKRVAAHSLQFAAAYDNRAQVQSMRESGELPAENQGLKGFVWEVFPRVLRAEKTGKLYARLNVTKTTRFSTVYFLDGKRADKTTVAPLLLASEISKGEIPLVLNVGIENLIALRA